MNAVPENIDYFKHPILIVDDDRDLLYSFKKEFSDTFTILTAESGREALGVLEEENISVMLVDQRMPLMTGVDLVKTAREKYPQVIRMLITAYSDIEVVIAAINEGKVYNYISKPWKSEELTDTIKKGIHVYCLSSERDRLYQEKLNAMKKLVISNRLNVVTCMAEGFADRLGNYLQAITTFFDTFPEKLEGFKKQLSNEISNEIRGILQGLYGASRSDADKMSKLTEEMRDFCRPPKYDFRKQESKVIIDIVNELTKILSPDIGKKTVRISKALEGKPPAVYFDKDTIKQVLYHLLRNSIHAIPETIDGSILVKVTGPIHKNGREFLRIIVQDNGEGIPEKHRENIFNPFFTTRGTAGGLGLGLMACQFIITQHEGEIELAQSESGRGSTFYVDLPVRNEPPVVLPDYRDMLKEFRNREK